ncbi:MAG TPA: arylsulfatase, partial [Bryobacteraceae bacterium]|nr:arylsulfatase [Bryobacteraceae bacterium]
VRTVCMNRRAFLTAFAGSPLSFAQPAARKPNIIFILADDLGYGDLGCYGQTKTQTPNIDKLASEGIRFTQAYAGSTVCAPSRCALMTGKHTGHGRIRGNTRLDLQPEDMTVPKLLKKAGYRTALIGKWGLGTAGHEGAPNKQGFDEFFGYLDQRHAHSYYPTHLWENDYEFFLPGNFGSKRTQYTHDLFTQRALSFVDAQNAAKPFFLYLAYTIPHANNELTKESGNGMEVPGDAPYSGRDWPQQDKNFAAMVTRLDKDVGRLMDLLKQKGLDQNTLVLFTSDNGPHREGGNRPEFFHSSGPLKGIKRALYEGGIRVPAIARWTGVIQPGRTVDQPWAFWDFLPTAAGLAGVAAPQGLDGISIAPVFRGESIPDRDHFYWEFHERGFAQAVRMGDWKGVRNPGAALELYNLKTDISEKNNVAAAHPDVVARLAAIMQHDRTDSPDFPVTRAARNSAQ